MSDFIKENFVPYEIAKEANELGYTEKCIAWYNEFGHFTMLGQDYGPLHTCQSIKNFPSMILSTQIHMNMSI